MADRNRKSPTREELLRATEKTVPDVIAGGLKVIFSGINPGLYTAWAGHHFAHPANRFWQVLFASGFTDRRLRPEDERQLLNRGYGITNLVLRATATAAEIPADELRMGSKLLTEKIRRYEPRWLAVLGIGAYRTGFARPEAVIGQQQETIGLTRIWVLPNTSGLNANHTPERLTELFRKLRARSG
ncbi:mismatch-specific DNA-glycosylase [Candidatus Gottesmanbacteria bacterium RBG_16_52_11]|uniref:Mismatch-specific DNA-glycosylase n=1 Tax=Candidatus Gottesmanbacteria bacterium RBG_16_52_11 TaxID=1798374 RepID=A0A1F5YXI4_9BACT|nr:MAG: mismatch-specific DNA-glycosylase [Candidatus Gottesmanbacteria bacterium RBG_16_52_11]